MSWKQHGSKNPTCKSGDHIIMTAREDSLDETSPILTDADELLRRGVVSNVPLPTTVDWTQWAERVSKPTMMQVAFEGDSEYPLYRNVMEEPDFPLQMILTEAIESAVIRYFGVNPSDETLTLDDAFCVHYDSHQLDTTGAKHMDPSDITVNMCLVKSLDCQGSHVLFHGSKPLHQCEYDDSTTTTFRVEQRPGFATLHWGNHPHETTALRAGERTNIIATYKFQHQKTDASTRSCYNV